MRSLQKGPRICEVCSKTCVRTAKEVRRLRRKRTRKDEEEAAAAVAAVADAIRKEEEFGHREAHAGSGVDGNSSNHVHADTERKLVQEVVNSERRRSSLKIQLAELKKELENIEERKKEKKNSYWTCAYCTFSENERGDKICAVCARTKPEGIEENEWSDSSNNAKQRAEMGVVDDTWTCAWCTFSGNGADDRICEVSLNYICI